MVAGPAEPDAGRRDAAEVTSRQTTAAALARQLDELARRAHELERSNEDLQRFAYAAAHDLKAPLARIEMALSALPRPEGEEGTLVDVARRGAERMRQLIDDLLTFSIADRPGDPPEEVDLEALLAEVLADLATTIASAGAEVVREPLPAAWGRRSLFGQVLQNLVSNSLKFTRPDTTPRIEITGARDDLGTTIRVSDNGIGVDEARREDVLGGFVRLNAGDRYRGSGIGLATCARIISGHGGELRLEDGIEGGVAVVVQLPPAPRDAR